MDILNEVELFVDSKKNEKVSIGEIIRDFKKKKPAIPQHYVSLKFNKSKQKISDYLNGRRGKGATKQAAFRPCKITEAMAPEILSIIEEAQSKGVSLSVSERTEHVRSIKTVNFNIIDKLHLYDSRK